MGNEPKNSQKWEDLLIEVPCQGCTKTAFTLPYKEDACHTVTCPQCGEVTIAHVVPGQGLVTATQEQRDRAVERLMDDVAAYLSTLEAHEYIQGKEEFEKNRIAKISWLRSSETSSFESITKAPYTYECGYLRAVATVRTNGLVCMGVTMQARTQNQHNQYYNMGFQCHGAELSLDSFKGRLLVAPRKK